MKLKILAKLAGLGFIASVIVHSMAWLQIEPPIGRAVFLLHIGIFVVFVPLVIYANRTMPQANRGNMEHLIALFPTRMKFLSGFLFLYAGVNFAYLFYTAQQFPKGKTPELIVLRGFSGHWMLFYGVACAGHVALARLSEQGRSTADSRNDTFPPI